MLFGDRVPTLKSEWSSKHSVTLLYLFTEGDGKTWNICVDVLTGTWFAEENSY